MKKKMIQLGTASAALAGLIGAFIWLQAPPETEGPAPEAEKTYVAGAPDGPAPAWIYITNEHGTFTIVNTAAGEDRPELTIAGWENFSLDSYALSGAFNAARAMEIKQVINENPTGRELAAYGLEIPRTSVLLVPGRNGKDEIKIGNDAPGGEGTYVRASGSSAVYLVSPSTANPFTRPPTDYVNRSVTETGADFGGFDRLVISGGLYPEPIVIERSPETEIEAAGMVFGTHRITSPIESGVAANSMEMLNMLFNITAEHVEAVGDSPETLKEFGLDNPDMSIDVKGQDAGHSFTLRVSMGGDDDHHGHGRHIYLIKSGIPIVYSLHDGALPWFGLPLFDIMEKMPLMPIINSVSRVTLTTPETAYVFNLSGEGDELTVTHGGAELETKNFRQFYQTLISARYIEEIPEDNGVHEKISELPGDPDEELMTDGDYAPAPDLVRALPILEIEYQYHNGAPADTVRLYPGPVRRAIISVNGGRSYYAASTYVDRVLEDVIKVISGEEVRPPF